MTLNRMTKGDKAFLIIDYILILLMVMITLYPMLYVLSASLSDGDAVVKGQVWLLPKGFNLDSYKRVFQDSEIWHSYANTIWYVCVGTLINLVMTTITAYPLARKKFWGRNFVMMAFAFTMFFSGGLIPLYMVVQKLHLIDTRWALVIPGAIATYNLILMRSFFEGIPEELHEAAKIDGSNDWGVFGRIILPLSKPVIAVMVLFYAVGHWNSYFGALIYLNKTDLYPLQLVLRKILIQLDSSNMTQDLAMQKDLVSQTIRYATIIVSTVPILCLYPFVQKYFVQGVMIGAIKG